MASGAKVEAYSLFALQLSVGLLLLPRLPCLKHASTPNPTRCTQTSQASRIDAQALVERLKTDDALSAMLRALGQAYPQLLPPLVHERDAYLAWSLKVSACLHEPFLWSSLSSAG